MSSKVVITLELNDEGIFSYYVQASAAGDTQKLVQNFVASNLPVLDSYAISQAVDTARVAANFDCTRRCSAASGNYCSQDVWVGDLMRYSRVLLRTALSSIASRIPILKEK